MDVTKFNMFRVVTTNCWSGSVLPRPTQHSEHGLMWCPGEIVQLIAHPGGDLYVAKSISFPGKNSEHHIWKREFRELTPDERKKAGLPARVGAPIGEVDVPVHLVPEDAAGYGEDEGSFKAALLRRKQQRG